MFILNLSYLREIFGRFVSRLCYSIDLSFYLRCLATPCTPNPSHAPSISLLFSLPPWLFAHICLSLPSFLMRPTSSWPLFFKPFSHPSPHRSTTMYTCPQEISFLLSYQAPPVKLSLSPCCSPPTIPEHSPTVFFRSTPSP